MLQPSDVNLAFAASVYNRQATKDEVTYWTGKPVGDLLQTIYNNSRERMTQLENGSATPTVVVNGKEYEPK